jgi:hypothetical protein
MPGGRPRAIADQEDALKTFDQIVVRLARCPDPARASSDDGLDVRCVTDRIVDSLKPQCATAAANG